MTPDLRLRTYASFWPPHDCLFYPLCVGALTYQESSETERIHPIQPHCLVAHRMLILKMCCCYCCLPALVVVTVESAHSLSVKVQIRRRTQNFPSFLSFFFSFVGVGKWCVEQHGLGGVGVILKFGSKQASFLPFFFCFKNVVHCFPETATSVPIRIVAPFSLLPVRPSEVSQFRKSPSAVKSCAFHDEHNAERSFSKIKPPNWCWWGLMLDNGWKVN